MLNYGTMHMSDYNDIVGVCIILSLSIIILSVCLVVVRQAKYNNAITLLKAVKNDEIVISFTNLENYNSSTQ